ncbi:MAG: DUF2213 domain-containing protein [Cyanobacteria bacterium P01_F01_bin.150]
MAHRLDNGRINNWQKLDDGRLRVMASVSRVGDLEYRLPNGERQIESLTAEELFNADSLDTAATAPVTLTHPPEFVTPKTWKKYNVGATGSQVFAKQDEGLVDIVFVVGDEEAIKAVEEDGIREVSAGYTTELKADGEKIYQTNRRYNHFALVPKGRAGETVALHMDSCEELAVQITNVDSDIHEKNEMKKYNGHEVSDAVYDMLKDMAEQLDMAKKDMGKKDATIDSLKTDASDAQSYRDKYAAAQAKVDSLEAENATLRSDLDGKMDASEVAKEIESRQTAWSAALPFLGSEAKLDASDDVLAIQLKAIKAVNPETKLDELATKWGDSFPVYVQATFDGLKVPTVEAKPASLKTDAYAEAIAKATVGGDRSGASMQSAKTDEAEKQRLDDMATLENMYRSGRAA